MKKKVKKEVFSKLNKIQKRISICKDVIALVRASKLNIQSGSHIVRL